MKIEEIIIGRFDESQINIPVRRGDPRITTPYLEEKGYSPMSVLEIVRLFNLKNCSIPEFYNPVNSGDGIIYHPDGRIKIDLDSENLKNLNKNSCLTRNGSLNLEKEKNAKKFEDLPDEINGLQLSFSPKEIDEWGNSWYTSYFNSDNKIWNAIIRGRWEELLKYNDEIPVRKRFSFLLNLDIKLGNLPKVQIERSIPFETERGVISGVFGSLNTSGSYVIGYSREIEEYHKKIDLYKTKLENLVNKNKKITKRINEIRRYVD